MIIQKATLNDEQAVFKHVDQAIRYAFNANHIHPNQDKPEDEIAYKMDYFRRILTYKDGEFYVLKHDEDVVGTVSFKQAEGDLLELTQNHISCTIEVGSLYIDPRYHNQGYGTQLFIFILKRLKTLGIDHFCLDCGYPMSQIYWRNLLGKPVLIDPNHFGLNAPLMIWKGDVLATLNRQLNKKAVKTMPKSVILTMNEQMNQGLIDSERLCEKAVWRHHQTIQKNAIAGLLSDYKLNAKALDQKRRDGKAIGPLHGIPMAIKDNIFYQDQLATTANTYAFKDFHPPYHATVVRQLQEAGVVILAKANLSELAYFMGGRTMPSGYGSLYGQVKHPYRLNIDPLGSSTGSAVAVKLGIVPAALGTETNGSLMAPAYQSQVVSFKPSFGLVSRYGVIPLAPTQDTVGPIAHTVYDCALIMDALNHEDPNDPTTLNRPRILSFTQMLEEKPKKGKVGLLSIKERAITDEEKMVLERAKKRLLKMGHAVIEFEIDPPNINNYATLLIEFKQAITQFFESFQDQLPFRTLRDLIDFNQLNEKRCLKYGQETLLLSDETDGDIESETYQTLRKELLEKTALLEKLIKENDLIAIGAPFWMGYAPIYGNPSICLPEGYFNKIPKAMVFVGAKYDDGRLLQFAHHYDQKRRIRR